jgi:hypothetical protein
LFTASLNYPGFCNKITATASSGCGTANAGPAFAVNGCSFTGDGQTVSGRVASWTSDLTVDHGRLQLIINGAAPVFPGRGRGAGVAGLVNGENRIEAVLVESAGKAGLWRIDLAPSDVIVEGSLRVISGEAVLLGASSATFRLNGREGDRIVFTFLKK